MHRIVTGVWFLQGLAMLAMCGAILLFPEWVAGIALAKVPTDGLVLLIAALQMTAAPLAALSLAAIYGAMRNDKVMRRRVARALTLGFGGYVVLGLGAPTIDITALPLSVQDFAQEVVYRSKLPDISPVGDLHFVGVGDMTMGPFKFIAGFALLAALWPVGARPGRSLSGRADTKPQHLWVAWLVQGAVVAFYAGVLFWFAHDFLTPYSGLFIVEDARPFLWTEDGFMQENAALRDTAAFLGYRSAPLWLAVAVVIWAGMRETNETEWRGFRNIHMLWLGTWVLTVCIAWDGAVFSWTYMIPAFVALLMYRVNSKAMPARGPFPPEETPEQPDGWTLIDILIGPLIAMRVLLGKRRGTHALGVMAKGHWVPARKPPDAPEHEFFYRKTWKDEATKSNGQVNVTMRFANVTFKDDAGMDVRGAALRIQPPGEKPLDLLMNTGSCGPIKNVKEFALLVFSKTLPKFIVAKAVKGNRKGREGGLAGLRRAPDSVTDLRYYSQATRYWLTPEDERLLARYRVVPEDEAVEETGLLSAEDQLASWKRDRRSDERRPKNYLRRELRQRLATTTVKMKLQVQIHRPRPGETLAWYDGMLDWPPKEHPWFDLGVAVLEHAASEEETERICFSPVNHPPSLGVPVAVDWSDPRSPADSERRIVTRTAALRTSMYAMLGLPGLDAEGNES